MTTIVLVSIINHYHINELDLFWDTLYMILCCTIINAVWKAKNLVVYILSGLTESYFCLSIDMIISEGTEWDIMIFDETISNIKMQNNTKIKSVFNLFVHNCSFLIVAVC